jgi:hypothetical protein
VITAWQSSLLKKDAGSLKFPENSSFYKFVAQTEKPNICHIIVPEPSQIFDTNRNNW